MTIQQEAGTINSSKKFKINIHPKNRDIKVAILS